VGPGTIGALLVMAAEPKNLAARLVTAGAMLAAIATVGLLLIMSGRLERLVGQQGLTILTKLTGLFVSAIAAQIFFTGLKNFLA
jgi:multiple antibiotic resistance protein